MISGLDCTINAKDAGPAPPPPKKKWDCLHLRTEYQKKNKMLHGELVIKLHDMKIFTGLNMPPALAIFFVKRMLTRDLFAVSNFLVIIQSRKCVSTLVTCNPESLVHLL